MLAEQSENGLPADYYAYLVTGGSGLTGKVPDTRITNVNALPPGPFQLTNERHFTYNSYAASPVHRFYQMWQQLDCSVAHATATNPSGCDAALFSWVEVTVGAGANGLHAAGELQHRVFAHRHDHRRRLDRAWVSTTCRTATRPTSSSLADNYAMSDNFHQSVNGGTGANHIMLGHGDAIWFSDGKGNAADAAAQRRSCAGHRQRRHRRRSRESQSRSRHQQLVHRGRLRRRLLRLSRPTAAAPTPTARIPTQPGVAPIVKYLQSLPRPIDPRCEAGHYYLLNNYNPGLLRQRQQRLHRHQRQQHGVHHSAVLHAEHRRQPARPSNISWKYYGDQWNNYVPDPYQLNYGAIGNDTDEYCNICNPFQYDTSIMANAAVRTAHIQDTANLYSDITERHAAGGFLRQAQRTGRRPPGLLEAGSVRRLHQEDRRRGQGQSDAVEGHRDLHHLR